MSNFTDVADKMINSEIKFDLPVVFSAGMGAGKSTYIKERGIKWLDEDKGFIVVVERKEDGRTLEAFFNRESEYKKARVKGTEHLYYAQLLCEIEESRFNAYFLEGYDPQICLENGRIKDETTGYLHCITCTNKNCKVKTQLKEASHCKCIIMTTAKHAIYNRTGTLIKFKECYFIDENGRKQVIPRKDCFIDECHERVKVVTVYDSDFTALLKSLPLEYYNIVTNLKEAVNERVGKNGDSGIIEPLNPAFPISGIRKVLINKAHQMSGRFNYKMFEVLNRVYYLAEYGGIYFRDYSKNDSVVYKINVSFRNKITNEHFNTFIFDGTALYDPLYKEDEFIFPAIEDDRIYDNVTVNVCKKNLSRSFYNDKPDVIEALNTDFSNINNAFLVTYKKHINKFDNIEAKNYIDNIKGSNKYVKYTNIIIAGINNIGEENFLCYAKALYDDLSTMNVVGYGRRFTDPRVESMKIRMMACDLLQNIFRCAIRNKGYRGSLNVYMFIEDKAILDYIQRYLNGAEFKEWYPTNFYEALNGARKYGGKNINRTKLTNYLKGMKVGQVISKQEMRKILGIGISQLSTLLKDYQIVRVIDEYGISVSRNKVSRMADCKS